MDYTVTFILSPDAMRTIVQRAGSDIEKQARLLRDALQNEINDLAQDIEINDDLEDWDTMNMDTLVQCIDIKPIKE